MPFPIVRLDSGVTRIGLAGDLRPELVGVVGRRPTAVDVDLSRLRSASARGMQVLVAFFTQAQPLKCPNAALVETILDASQPVN